MKMITGLLKPPPGRSCSTASLSARPHRLQTAHGHVPEEPHLYGHLSGLEYLIMVSQLRNPLRQASMDCIDGLLRLSRSTATGMRSISAYRKVRQRCCSAALMHNPDLLLLDEPFSGLDVGTGLVLRSLIQELAARGKVVLFSSHELETV